MGKIKQVIMGDVEQEEMAREKLASKRAAKKEARAKLAPSIEEVIPQAEVEIETDSKTEKKKSKKKELTKYQFPIGKKLVEANSKVEKNKLYSIKDAIELVKKTSFSKFDGSVELHANLADKGLRGSVSLPHGTGKEIRVKIADDAFITNLEATGKIDFDILVADPAMMPKLAKVAKILGPKGLMPNPKTETVSPNVKKMIEELKKGKITFKNDDTSNIHQSIGKVSFSEAQLKENLGAFLDVLKRAKPATAKGTYLQTLVICTTMGPAIRIASEA
jgi:large subunit ribosomal protein L1